VLTLHVEYAERRRTYGILFIVSRFVNTLTLNMYGFLAYTGLTRRNTLFVFVWVNPAYTGSTRPEYGIHILVAASKE